MEVASEIVTTITEPSLMVGPEVREGGVLCSVMELVISHMDMMVM